MALFSPSSPVMRWIASRAPERIERLAALPPQEALDRTFAGLRRALPLVLIAFLPFFAIALHLLYLRSGTYFVEHLVFAIHAQSTLFLALVLGWLVGTLLGVPRFPAALIQVGLALSVLTIWVPIALQRVYGGRRWATALRAVVLLLVYSRLIELVVATASVFALYGV